LFGRTFDLVMLTKVLEHVPDPAPFVQDLAKDLGPRGVLFLEVPDVLDLELLPPDHDRFYIPHIYYFSRAALAELVQRAGLAVLTARTVTGQRNRSYLQLLAARA
jgi:2-polyprenyl-3-methyl-5-hydroxy-6-metoxy-1,4-benzoquinol methylase